MTDLTYALVTPVRDEERNLRRLAEAVASQDVAPNSWVIVDNGSKDGSVEFARELQRRHRWVRVLSSPPTDVAEPGGPVVRAFHVGVQELKGPIDIVVKLDADVSFEPDYFKRLLSEFSSDRRLGIASGECLEQKAGRWHIRPVTAGHARGATRAYRWQCLQDVLPLPERVGWDTVDEVKANVLGWTTGTIPGVRFYHHRAVGARDGAPWSRWVRQGTGAHYVGYRFPYLLARTMHRSLRNPAAIGMLVGYAVAVVKRSERHEDRAVLEHLRRRQSMHRLPLRAREALGRVRGSIGI
jgi:glycosyltransferase involved in cell wall biosynthesis